jgi:hypothetical protein
MSYNTVFVNLLFLGAKNQLMQKAEGEAGSRIPEPPSAAEIKALRNVIRKATVYMCELLYLPVLFRVK